MKTKTLIVHLCLLSCTLGVLYSQEPEIKPLSIKEQLATYIHQKNIDRALEIFKNNPHMSAPLSLIRIAALPLNAEQDEQFRLLLQSRLSPDDEATCVALITTYKQIQILEDDLKKARNELTKVASLGLDHTAQEHINLLQEKNTLLIDEASKRTLELIQLQESMIQITTKYSECEQEKTKIIETLKTKTEELDTLRASHTEQIKLLKADIEYTQLMAKQQYDALVVDHDKELAEFRMKLENANETIRTIKNTLEATLEQKKQYEKQLQTLEEQLSVSRETINTLSKEVDEKNTQLSAAHYELSATKKQLQDTLVKLKKLEKQKKYIPVEDEEA